MRFDVVVAGGGTAGCVVAARLSEEPSRSVCLVEAGPDYGRYERGLWPADLLDGFRLAFSHSWETEREDRSQLRARVLGGCSAHNACVVLRGVSSDYDWGDGWSYAALEPYFDRAEEMLPTSTRRVIAPTSPSARTRSSIASRATPSSPTTATSRHERSCSPRAPTDRRPPCCGAAWGHRWART
jgi:choline dehydrogenase-like flavoprotein